MSTLSNIIYSADKTDTIRSQAHDAVCELCEKAGLTSGNILVVGCSSSEAAGGDIGTYSSPQIAEAIYDGIQSVLSEKGIYLAAQCCEHLNRAIVIEKKALFHPEIVNVIPSPQAGGSFAAKVYNSIDEAVVVEHIKADAGIDIGNTLIGMHLKEVAVPIRLSVKMIGSAAVTAARTRAKFIGGERAVYDHHIM